MRLCASLNIRLCFAATVGLHGWLTGVQLRVDDILVDRSESSVTSSILPERDSKVEIVNDNVAILGGLAKILAVTELKTEVVGSADSVTDPVTGSEQEVVGESEGNGEIWRSGEYQLDHGHVNTDSQQGQLQNSVHELSVAREGAVERRTFSTRVCVF